VYCDMPRSEPQHWEVAGSAKPMRLLPASRCRRAKAAKHDVSPFLPELAYFLKHFPFMMRTHSEAMLHVPVSVAVS